MTFKAFQRRKARNHSVEGISIGATVATRHWNQKSQGAVDTEEGQLVGHIASNHSCKNLKLRLP